MGRYRELVRALVYYANSTSRSANAVKNGNGRYKLNQNEYQILEYICEFEDENRIMADISRDTGILQSIVTKSTKRLVELKLVERYHIPGNRKSIILKPTALGKEVYLEYAGEVQSVFQEFFRALETADDRELSLFEHAVRMLGGDWGNAPDRILLERIDQ
jgi:DNA-binding MarR family transcriptional regulator